MAADRGTTNIAGCVPLIMSWIYQRFPTFCSEARDVIVFPLVSRLTGYRQMNRDSHERRMVQIRSQLDRLGVHEGEETVGGRAADSEGSGEPGRSVDCQR
ncbi:hypothetical protein PIB30_021415 [Stylosanthes scabra]|uniref:Uncharacterized protein n=1 Tax=Stylosanthes scabra TaxID=79078 RepID=A0ABU6UC26_9FABA|nr:hypothetical protein [Stylosanthes scabra]